MNHTTSKITNMTEGNPVRIIMVFAVTEPVIWCLCALFLGTFYVTIGHQKQTEENVG